MPSIWELNFKEEVSQGIGRVERQMAEAFSKMERYEKQFERNMRNASTAVRGVDDSTKNFLKTVGSVVSVAAVAQVGKEMLTTGSAMEQNRIAFQTLLQSVELGNSTIAQLKEYADLSPFDLEGTIQSGKSLLAMGIAAKDLIPTMNVLGDLSMGNQANFSSLIDNYGKMMAAQTVYSRDILQFANAGVPIMGALEKVTGKSGKALKDMIEGGMDVSVIQQALMGLTTGVGAFSGMMDKQGKSLMGRWNTLMGGLQTAAIESFDRLQPYLSGMVEWVINILPTAQAALGGMLNVLVGVGSILKEHWTLIKTIGGAVLFMYTAYQLTNGVMWVQNTILKAVAFAQKAYVAWMYIQEGASIQATLAQLGLNTAMLANPAFWVVAGLMALGAAVVWAWNKFEGFRGFMYGLWGAMKEIGSGIADIFKNAFGGIAKILMGIATFDWAMVKDGAMDMSKALIDANPISFAMNHGKAIGQKFNEGYAEGVADFRTEKAADGKPKPKPGTSILANHDILGKYNPAAGGKGGAGAGGKDGAGEKGEGSAKRNVTVTIHNLVGKIELHTTNVTQGLADLQDNITTHLIGAVRDYETGIAQE